VKQLENFFRTLSLTFLGVFVITAVPAAAQQEPDPMDNIEIGLITCSPHDEVYSLYGHSAIHYRDKASQLDIVFSYGVFNYNKPFFIGRFMFGLTDYELGVYSFPLFCKEYERWGAQVAEQVLNLTPNEKRRITEALFENAKPNNRTYRYNFFYDNCSTRPRDIIERHLDGKIEYKELTTEREKTYRQLLHEKTANHCWTAFGSDLLLGFKADMKADIRQQQFLPENLQLDFMTANIVHDGQQRPLVKEYIVWRPLGQQAENNDNPLRPIYVFTLLLIVSIAIFIYEEKRKTCLRWFDATLMTITGLAGVILFVMIFSQHPATSTNLQILILNPLALGALPNVIRGRSTRWFRLSFVCIIAFFAGWFLQDYAEGMEILALCLLLRYWRHRHEK